MWARAKAAWRVLVAAPDAASEIAVRRAVARVDIKLAGSTVSTDMDVTVPVLEQLANGIGMTLVVMPSKGRH